MTMSGSTLHTRRESAASVVVKTGGSLIEATEYISSLCEDVMSLSSAYRFTIVNGGGREIDRLCNALSIPVEKIDGLRVTTPQVMDIVQMALARSSNGVVTALHSAGLKAVPVPAFSASTAIVEKRISASGRDLGSVGRVVSVDTSLLESLQEQGVIPVVYPVAMDAGGRLYNVNADEMASELSVALQADALLLMTDVEGVLVDSRPLASLKVGEFRALGSSGHFTAGMIPKLEAAAAAAERGVRRVCIMDGRKQGSLLSFFKEGNLNGTEVQK